MYPHPKDGYISEILNTRNTPFWFSRGNSHRSTKRVQTYSKRPRSLWPAHSKASWVKGWEIKQTFSVITCTCNQVTVGNSMLSNWQFLSIPFTCDIRMHNLLFCIQVSNLYKFQVVMRRIFLTVKDFFCLVIFWFLLVIFMSDLAVMLLAQIRC